MLFRFLDKIRERKTDPNGAAVLIEEVFLLNRRNQAIGPENILGL
jgi:hypothetical protein